MERPTQIEPNKKKSVLTKGPVTGEWDSAFTMLTTDFLSQARKNIHAGGTNYEPSIHWSSFSSWKKMTFAGRQQLVFL